MTDDPDITPPWPIAAESRRRIESEEHALELTRQLFRTARHPRADALWPALRPWNIAIAARCRIILAAHPDERKTKEILAEVLGYLGAAHGPAADVLGD